MNRLYSLLLCIISQISVFAQRGRVRPEWDIDGGNSSSHHSVNDDFYSTLLFLGLIALFFLYCFLYGVFVGGPKEKARIKLEKAHEEEINKRLVYVFKKNTMSFNDEKIIEDVYVKKGERCIIVKIYDDYCVVVEMLDARIPLASQNPDLRKITEKKKKIIVLNKIDLSNASENKNWIKYFDKSGIKIQEHINIDQ